MIALAAASFLFAGCTTMAQYETDEVLYEKCYCGMTYLHEAGRRPTPPLNIEENGIDTEFLNTFETIHAVTHLAWETDWYSTLAFWSDVPLFDFSFVSLCLEVDDDPYRAAFYTFYTTEVLFAIDKLMPSDVIVMDVSLSHYLIPEVGFMFTDENNLHVRMFLRDASVRGGCDQCFIGYMLTLHDETYWADWR